MNYDRPSPVELAKRFFETAAKLMPSGNGDPERWDDVDQETRTALAEAMELVVCNEIDQLIEMIEDERLDMALDRSFADNSPSPPPQNAPSGTKCYYCSKKLAIVGYACGDCLRG
jgi:hypothetical protein